MKSTKTLTEKDLKDAFEKFMAARNEPNARLLSWEHCFAQFAAVFEDLNGGALSPHDVSADKIDYLCLHLGFYLASWGMMRGSSKLLHYDYKVHRPLVEAVLKHSGLYGKDLSDFCDKDDGKPREQFNALHDEVVKHCEQFSTAKTYSASDILVSKIIMGTLGIAPAYDTNLSNAVETYGISNGSFSPKSFEAFAAYFTENYADTTQNMTEAAQRLCPHYTRAKVIDALLWFIGQDEEPAATGA